ncbi:MAG: glutaredoxin [Thermoplasmata archaeon]|nr:glutaredoxin [Thermoplasmata archaeon]
MALISDKDKDFITETFADRLRSDVTVLFFTQEHECMYCRETRGFVEELTALSDKLHLETYDLVNDAEVAATHGIDKIPAIKLIGEQDHGVRYFGMPMGYEFTVIVEDIIDVSWGTSNMDPETMGNVLPIDKKTHIQVFVSPTCPYCPQMVRAAHKFAILNPSITADMVEMTEFPHLVQKYDVMGVPKTIVNEEFSIEGAYPEKAFSEYVKMASEGKFGKR